MTSSSREWNWPNSSSFMYLCIPCYCDACLKSNALRVGVKTLHNTMQSRWSATFVLTAQTLIIRLQLTKGYHRYLKQSPTRCVRTLRYPPQCESGFERVERTERTARRRRRHSLEADRWSILEARTNKGHVEIVLRVAMPTARTNLLRLHNAQPHLQPVDHELQDLIVWHTTRVVLPTWPDLFVTFDDDGGEQSASKSYSRSCRSLFTHHQPP